MMIFLFFFPASSEFQCKCKIFTTFRIFRKAQERQRRSEFEYGSVWFVMVRDRVRGASASNKAHTSSNRGTAERERERMACERGENAYDWCEFIPTKVQWGARERTHTYYVVIATFWGSSIAHVHKLTNTMLSVVVVIRKQIQTINWDCVLRIFIRCSTLCVPFLCASLCERMNSHRIGLFHVEQRTVRFLFWFSQMKKTADVTTTEKNKIPWQPYTHTHSTRCSLARYRSMRSTWFWSLVMEDPCSTFTLLSFFLASSSSSTWFVCVFSFSIRSFIPVHHFHFCAGFVCYFAHLVYAYKKREKDLHLHMEKLLRFHSNSVVILLRG